MIMIDSPFVFYVNLFTKNLRVPSRATQPCIHSRLPLAPIATSGPVTSPVLKGERVSGFLTRFKV